MRTLGIVAAVVGVGALFWYFNRRQGTSAPAVVNRASTATTLENKIQNGANQIGSLGGSLVAKLIPGAAPATNVFAQQGRDIVGGTVQGFRTAGTGLTQIGSGNVLAGAKNVGLGAAETAYAATGAKAVVNGLRSLF
jgi:hypothetical protein